MEDSRKYKILLTKTLKFSNTNNQNSQWAPVLQQPSPRAAEASPRPQIQSPIQANKLKPPKTNTTTLKKISNPYLCKNPHTTSHHLQIQTRNKVVTIVFFVFQEPHHIDEHGRPLEKHLIIVWTDLPNTRREFVDLTPRKLLLAQGYRGKDRRWGLEGDRARFELASPSTVA